MERLDPNSPVPLYHQLFVRLRDAISAGTYPAAGLLPSEAELEAAYGVSRITVRRAIEELRQRNFVTREKGRGTRVVARRLVATPLIGSVEGMLENNLAMGLETSVDLLEFDYLPAGREIAERLGVKPGAAVQHSVRVRRHDGVPFSHLTTFVPERIGRLYTRDDLSFLPLLVLLETHGLKIGHAEQAISAEAASPRVAQCLDVEAGRALLRVDRTVYDVANRAVQHIIALYRPEIYAYRMRLVRKGGKKAMRWMPLG